MITKPCFIRVTKTIPYRGNLKLGAASKYLVVMKVCYISARYNKSPLYMKCMVYTVLAQLSIQNEVL